MLVRQVMNRTIVTAKGETTIKEASKIMGEMHIGCLIITEDDKIKGLVTNSDLLRAIARDCDPATTTLQEIMSKDVKVIEPERTLEDAIKLMVEHKIKKLPVVEDNKLIGIITASDIAVVQPKLVASISSLLSIRVPVYSGG